MARQSDKYADFVEHPRYGRRPKVSGLNPRPRDPGVRLHWNAVEPAESIAMYEAGTGKPWPYAKTAPGPRRSRRIPNTAIPADLTRQTPSTVGVTHYFDLLCQCVDCERPFIFFAAEQKHWYEELGFGLESDCVRCVECRKRQQGIARQREVFESLYHIPERTVDESLEMAEACLSLIEAGEFTPKQTERVRMLMNEVPEDADVRKRSRYADLMKREIAIEQDVNPRAVDRNGDKHPAIVLAKVRSAIEPTLLAAGFSFDGRNKPSVPLYLYVDYARQDELFRLAWDRRDSDRFLGFTAEHLKSADECELVAKADLSGVAKGPKNSWTAEIQVQIDSFVGVVNDYINKLAK